MAGLINPAVINPEVAPIYGGINPNSIIPRVSAYGELPVSEWGSPGESLLKESSESALFSPIGDFGRWLANTGTQETPILDGPLPTAEQIGKSSKELYDTTVNNVSDYYSWALDQVRSGRDMSREWLTDFFEGADVPINENVAEWNNSNPLGQEELFELAKDGVDEAVEHGKKVFAKANEKLPGGGGLEPPEKNDTPAEIAKKKTNNQAVVAMAQNGATEQDLSAWAKLNEEFDMTTVGLALLATNDGSANVGQNIGKAMMLGRQAKSSAGAAGRKEAREERDIRVKEYKAMTDNWYKRASLAAANNAPGLDLPSANELGQINTFVQTKIDEGGWGAELADDFVLTNFATQVKQALQYAKPGQSLGQVMQDVWNATIGVKDEFSFGPTYETK